MNHYEVTLVLTPVLSESEVKKAIKTYTDYLKKNKAEVTNEEHWGLRQLAYPIVKKTSGIYHLVEFKAEATLITDLELTLKRDDNILRYLTVKLDKYALKFNNDKKNKKAEEPATAE